MSSSIVSPFPVFNDLNGTPLEAGYIYIGQSNLNPETAPINVFWDAACTIPAAQPIRTVGGYASRNGTPSRLYVTADTYSITVRNRNSVFVFSAFNQTDAPTSVFDISTQVITATAGQVTFALTTFAYLPGTDTLQVYRNGLRLTAGTDYLETNSSTVTLTTAAAAGDEFLFQGGGVITGNQTPGTSVSFIQAGAGAVTRNIQDKARESVSVLDFGADPTGATDSSVAINAALASGNSIEFPWGIYKCKDIVVGTHQSLYCNGSIFKPASGANWVFKLKGYKPALFDAYFDGTSDPIPDDLAHAAVMVGDNLDTCIYAQIQNCTWVNHTLGLLIGGNASYVASQGMVTNCNFINFSKRGILLAKNALDWMFTDINIRAGTVAGTGGAIPKSGAIGFQHVGTGGTLGRGGHLLASVSSLESETAFQFTDSELVSLQNCIADSVSGAGYQITTTGAYALGVGSAKINFDNCFAGTCKVGYEVTGGALDIKISDASTYFQGVIPPWGGSNFFKTTGNYAVARDIYLDSTSYLYLSGWKSDAYSNLIAGTISISESQGLFVGSTAQVTAASTVYLTTAGALASELMMFVAPKKGIIYGLNAQSGVAPGAGETFVYIVRKQFVDSGTTSTTSGASSFGSSSAAITAFNAGENISVKLVTSATAAASTHRVSLKVAYFG